MECRRSGGAGLKVSVLYFGSWVTFHNELGHESALRCMLFATWRARNPNVSSVITGASRVEQVHENMGALEVIPRLSDEVVARLEGAGRSAS